MGDQQDDHEDTDKVDRTELARIAFVAAAAAAVWFRVWEPFARVSVLGLVGTLAVDAVGVGLAAMGLLKPLLAAFIHVASELTFILNSARLLPRTSRTQPRAHTRTAATAVVPAA
jgi:hypothetical protein